MVRRTSPSRAAVKKQTHTRVTSAEPHERRHQGSNLSTDYGVKGLLTDRDLVASPLRTLSLATFGRLRLARKKISASTFGPLAILPL